MLFVVEVSLDVLTKAASGVLELLIFWIRCAPSLCFGWQVMRARVSDRLQRQPTTAANNCQHCKQRSLPQQKRQRKNHHHHHHHLQ